MEIESRMGLKVRSKYEDVVAWLQSDPPGGPYPKNRKELQTMDSHVYSQLTAALSTTATLTVADNIFRNRGGGGGGGGGGGPGPQGPRGERGPQGRAGRGYDGRDGPRGPRGRQGPAGTLNRQQMMQVATAIGNLIGGQGGGPGSGGAPGSGGSSGSGQGGGGGGGGGGGQGGGGGEGENVDLYGDLVPPPVSSVPPPDEAMNALSGGGYPPAPGAGAAAVARDPLIGPTGPPMEHHPGQLLQSGYR